MKIYTKGGDKGETSLFNGERVSKASALVNAYGTVDELTSVLGIARAMHKQPDRLAEVLYNLQLQLFDLATDLASAAPEAQRINDGHVEDFEQVIDEFEARLEPLASFIVPSGHIASCHLHQARTICRRAERMVIAAGLEHPVDPVLVRYLNRLADLLFVLAREANRANGVREEKKPSSEASEEE